MSVSETLYHLIVVGATQPAGGHGRDGLVAEATALQKRLNVPDKRFWHIKVKVRACVYVTVESVFFRHSDFDVFMCVFFVVVGTLTVVVLFSLPRYFFEITIKNKFHRVLHEAVNGKATACTGRRSDN